MEESRTLLSLSAIRSRFEHLGIRVLVIDNTPGREAGSRTLDNETDYLSFGENRGLARAYQAACERAQAEQYRYLVLFDQTRRSVGSIWTRWPRQPTLRARRRCGVLTLSATASLSVPTSGTCLGGRG